MIILCMLHCIEIPTFGTCSNGLNESHLVLFQIWKTDGLELMQMLVREKRSSNIVLNNSILMFYIRLLVRLAEAMR